MSEGRVTARQDLVEAAGALASRGVLEFSPAELIAEAQRRGTSYPDVTLRSMITYHLRVEEGVAAPEGGFVLGGSVSTGGSASARS